MYHREAMYLGMAFTQCRLAEFIEDDEEAQQKREEAHENFLETFVGVLLPAKNHDPFCDQVEQYEKLRAGDSSYTKTIYQHIEDPYAQFAVGAPKLDL